MTVNPWDRLPTRAKGDPRKATTYRAVGLALSNWEFYEFSLVLIFRCVINADWDGPVEDAFGSILAHKGRVEMLQAAANTYFKHRDGELKKEMNSLLEKASKLCARRNEIAHGHVTRLKIDGKDCPGWFLLPSYFATSKHEILAIVEVLPGGQRMKAKRRPLYAYTAKDIDHYAREFWELSQAAGRMAMAVVDRRMDAKMRALAGDDPELLRIWTERATLKSRNSRTGRKRPKPSPEG